MLENNFCVIMAGGIGSRFWPFSRNARPKQFLDFFGTGKSLLQMTVDRFRPLVPIRNVFIVTNVLYRDMILAQIPDITSEQVLCEPARRNTAPCIAYALARIRAVACRRKGIDPAQPWVRDNLDVNIVVAPSDHLILQESKFQEIIRKGFDFIAKTDALLTLGMCPTRPETGYGYIQAEGGSEVKDGVIYRVRAFTEKPNLDMAKVFVKSGDFLWNSGIFLWNLKSIASAFRTYLPDVVDKFDNGNTVMGTPAEDVFIQEMFPTCPNISIDYGIMEKAKNVYVMPSDFGWSDLGTWGSLYEMSDKDEHNNVTLHSQSMFYESSGNVVTLPEGHLAVIQGLNDTIVAEADGVLLICKKEAEQQIRQFVMDAESKFNGQYN